MTIENLHVVNLPLPPLETNPPEIIDRDAVPARMAVRTVRYRLPILLRRNRPVQRS